MKKVKKQCNVHCTTSQKEEKKKQGNERIRTKGLKKEEEMTILGVWHMNNKSFRKRK